MFAGKMLQFVTFKCRVFTFFFRCLIILELYFFIQIAILRSIDEIIILRLYCVDDQENGN